ncbi:MAG: GTP cyclohydrolase II [Aquirhabdus sp.]
MSVQFIANALLPTKHGDLDISVFQDPATGEEHVALSKGLIGQAQTNEPVLIRVHSECLTGDAFGSLRCDCGPQLDATLALIERTGRGAVLYLRQEGRGIGLTNKIRAYALQDQGHDTVDANLLLNLPIDARTYEMTLVMLNHFKVKAVRLLTNNPLKVEALQEYGIDVVERVPLHVGLNPSNLVYINTKKNRMGHLPA